MTTKYLPFAISFVVLLYAGAMYLKDSPSTTATSKSEPQSTKDALFPGFELELLKSAGRPFLKNKSIDLKNVTLSNFTGNFVLVNFWASWCEVCKGEKPYLRALQLEFYKRKFTVFGIGTADSRKKIMESDSLEMMTYPVAFDGPGVLMEQLNVRALPVSYLLTPEGTVIRRIIGPITESIAAELQQYLDKKTPSAH